MEKKTKNILNKVANVVAVILIVGFIVGFIYFNTVDYKSGEYKLDASVPAEQCATLYIQHLKPLLIDDKAIAGSKFQNILISIHYGGVLSELTDQDISIDSYYKIIIPEGNHKIVLGCGYDQLEFDIELKAGKKYIATEIEIEKDLKDTVAELVSGSTKHRYKIIPYTKNNAEKYGVLKYWKK